MSLAYLGYFDDSEFEKVYVSDVEVNHLKELDGATLRFEQNVDGDSIYLIVNLANPRDILGRVTIYR